MPFVHVQVAPDTALSLASLGEADRLAVAPMDESVIDDGLTATLATRWATDTGTSFVAVPPFAEHVTVIVTWPLEFAVTRPPEVTDAADPVPFVHVQVAPDTALPLASLGEAVRLAVAPMDESVIDDGLTDTLFGRWLTVTDTVPEALPPFLDAVAVIVALPLPFAVMRPFEDTVATDVESLVQLIVAPDTT